ncbi:sigma factor for late transcription protein [Rhizobium phage RHph_I1_18]|nr:sigma factor for late transcription protein [Rhizobium phage RHph_I1_18]
MNNAAVKLAPTNRAARAKRGDRDYVKNSDLYEALATWYKSGKEQIPDKITIAIMQICERLSRKGNFCNYTYREDMVASALAVCVVALQKHKFDVNQAQRNPFAYFTQIAYNEMVRVIKLEKTHSYIKHKALDQHITDSMLAGEPVDVPLFDHGSKNYDLIRYFEPEKETVETASQETESQPDEEI